MIMKSVVVALIGGILIALCGCDGANTNCQVYRSGNIAYCRKCGSHCIICTHESKFSNEPCDPWCNDCQSHDIRVMRASDYYKEKNARKSR